MSPLSRNRGFTLVEAIIAMVITGIIAGIVAVFIATPVQGYIDTVRRAGLTDVADLALKRMALDIRTAVPNTVRVDPSGRYLEFIPGRMGGRYCSDSDPSCPSGTGGALSFSFSGSGGDVFDVLGPAHDAVAGEFLVIYNTGQSGLNAYDGSSRRTIVAAGTTTTAIGFDGVAFPFESPSRRFQVVPSTGPITFACEGAGGGANGTGTLRRYTGYNTGATFKDPQATTGLGTGALLADGIAACNFQYQPVNARNGLASLSLTLRRENETVTLMYQIHVDNMP